MAPWHPHDSYLSTGPLFAGVQRDECRTIKLCQLQGGTCWLIGDLTSATEADLALPFSMWIKHFCIQCLTAVFPHGDLETKMQWSEVLRFLLLTTGNRCHLIPKELKSLSLRDKCTPMLIMAKSQKQPKYQQMKRMKKTLYVYICTLNIIQPWQKEGNPVICNDMDEPGRHYAKWNKSATGKQILQDSTHMRSLK